MRMKKIVDWSIEKDIITGMIISNSFLSQTHQMVKLEYLQQEASVTLVKWILVYYDKYGKAPGKDIQGIFQDHRLSLEEEKAEWIAGFLSELSSDYEERGFNEAYVFDRAKEYCKKRKLWTVSKRVLELLEKGSVDKAEEVYVSSKKLEVEHDLGIDPLDPNTVDMLVDDPTRFTMKTGIRGLDKLMGRIKSEWLVMFMGPMKRGKTQALWHMGIVSASAGFNTVIISLESGYQDMAERLWMNIGSFASYGDGLVKIPSFISEDGDDVELNEMQRPMLKNKRRVRNKVAAFRKQVGARIMMKSFPAYSAGMEDIRRYLDALESMKNFSPHVIVIDYLGALKEPRGVQGRDVYNANSRSMKGLSQERKAIVLSAHQGTKLTLDKMNMHPTDVPEDVRILGNIDVLLGLNQTEEEKEEGVIRINVLMHRFRRFNRRKQVKVLQQPEVGQFHLDDRIIEAPKEKLKTKLLGDNGD